MRKYSHDKKRILINSRLILKRYFYVIKITLLKIIIFPNDHQGLFKNKKNINSPFAKYSH